jgi:hypothetical protein
MVAWAANLRTAAAGRVTWKPAHHENKITTGEDGVALGKPARIRLPGGRKARMSLCAGLGLLLGREVSGPPAGSDVVCCRRPPDVQARHASRLAAAHRPDSAGCGPVGCALRSVTRSSPVGQWMNPAGGCQLGGFSSCCHPGAVSLRYAESEAEGSLGHRQHQPQFQVRNSAPQLVIARNESADLVCRRRGGSGTNQILCRRPLPDASHLAGVPSPGSYSPPADQFARKWGVVVGCVPSPWKRSSILRDPCRAGGGLQGTPFCR